MEEISFHASSVLGGGLAALSGGALAGVASYGGAMMFATASTGTAIGSLTGVAATNATLAWFGGGSLAAGGLGMSGGMLVLGGIVTGPILLIGGMILGAKAKEKLAKAESNLAEARLAAEQMKNVQTALKGIASISNAFYDLISKFLTPMDIILDNLEEIVKDSTNYQKLQLGLWAKVAFKIKKLLKVNTKCDYTKLDLRKRKTVHLAVQFAQSLKMLLETPLLTQDGSLRIECNKALTEGNTIFKQLTA